MVNTTRRQLYPWEKRPRTYCSGGWMGPRAGLDGSGKSRPYRDLIPGPFSRQQVAIRLRHPGPKNISCSEIKDSDGQKYERVTTKVNLMHSGQQTLYNIVSKTSVISLSWTSYNEASSMSRLTLRRLMSYIYIYMEHPFLMFLDHTQRRSTVGRTPLDE